jgi:hypothetical protein
MGENAAAQQGVDAEKRGLRIARQLGEHGITRIVNGLTESRRVAKVNALTRC